MAASWSGEAGGHFNEGEMHRRRQSDSRYGFTTQSPYIDPETGRPTIVYKGGGPGDAFDQSAWGGVSGTVDPATGTFVPHRRKVDEDVARYRGLGEQRQAAIQLDQTRADEARGIQMGALGMLGEAAAGNAPSRAAILGQAGVEDATRAGTQAAAGARGPGAAIAAMRGAGAGAGQQAVARSGGAIDARVGEMDAARGQYMGGTGTVRGQDIGAATTNAQLEMQQRAADAQRQQYYEQLAWNTENAVLGNILGRSASEQAAANANRAQGLAESKQAFENTKQIGSGIIGGVQGGVQAYGQYQAAQQNAPAPRQSWEDQRDVAMSDSRAKYILSDDRAKVQAAERKAYLLGRAHGVEQSVTKESVPFSYGGPPKKGEDIVDADPWHASRVKSQPSKIERKAAVGRYGRADPSQRDMQRAVDEAIYAQEYDADTRRAPALSALGATLPVAAPVVAADHVRTAMKYGTSGPPRRDGSGGAPPPSPEPRRDRQSAQPMYASLSDERTKDKSGTRSMASANRSMAPSAYAYKPEYRPAEQKPGEVNVGPMAQSMARDPVAKTAIVERPDGMLAIDKDKGLKLVMGGLASLQREVDGMKKRRAK